jgi:hypothetical protein
MFRERKNTVTLAKPAGLFSIEDYSYIRPVGGDNIRRKAIPRAPADESEDYRQMAHSESSSMLLSHERL